MAYYLKPFNLAPKPDTTHLFLAEGEAEVGFIEAYLNELQADAKTNTILCFEGLSKVHGHSKTLAKIIAGQPGGLDRIRAIGLMADADNNPTGRIDLIIECATAFGFPKSAQKLREGGRCEVNGRKFCFALSPSKDREGNIETLILGEIGKTPIFECLGQSFACIEKLGTALLQPPFRLRIATRLPTMNPR